MVDSVFLQNWLMLVSEISSKCGQKCAIVAIEKFSVCNIADKYQNVLHNQTTLATLTTPTFKVLVATHTLILTSNFSLKISVFLTT